MISKASFYIVYGGLLVGPRISLLLKLESVNRLQGEGGPVHGGGIEVLNAKLLDRFALVFNCVLDVRAPFVGR